MHRLEQVYYDRARSIFAGLAETQLNIMAVLNGISPGEIYVDDAVDPQTAYNERVI
jgi:hypothetical protein